MWSGTPFMKAKGAEVKAGKKKTVKTIARSERAAQAGSTAKTGQAAK